VALEAAAVAGGSGAVVDGEAGVGGLQAVTALASTNQAIFLLCFQHLFVVFFFFNISALLITL
jgi:hypothetical protein